MDREPTKREIHNGKLEQLASQAQKRIKGLIQQQLVENSSKFDSVDDVRFFVEKFDFKAIDLFDTKFRNETWAKINFQNSEDRKQRRQQKQNTKKTWEIPRK